MSATRAETLIVLALLAGLAPAAASEPPEGLEKGPSEYFNLTDSPFSGPVEVIVNTNHPTAARGSFTDVFIVVRNHSNEADVSVNIDLDLRYADGRRVRPFHLGADRIQLLGPDQGVAFFIFFVVPPDAPLGTATFRVDGRVGRVTGTDDDHSQNENPMVASDSVEFEVTP